MKKLLSILATVGLVSTAGAAVVACGETNGPKATTRDASVPSEVTYALSKKYDNETSLEKEDKEALKNNVLGALKEANKDCNFTDEDFDIKIPEEIKKTETSLKVEVKKTEPTDEKLGFNATSLDVKIKLTNPVAQVEAQGVKVSMNLTKTTEELPLHKDDKVELEKQIIAALKDKNKDVVFDDNTFSVKITDNVTPKTKEIFASNKETDSTGQKPGLVASDKIKVELELTPIKGKVPAKGADVVMDVSTGPGDFISDEDKGKLTEEIKGALELANSNAIVNEDTFDFDLPEDLKDGKSEIEVFVHETQGTTEKNGLMNGPVKVTFNLRAYKDKMDARGVDVEFKLAETHLGEKLTDNDKAALQAEILGKLEIANNDAVVLEDTFGFEALDSVTARKEFSWIGVTVKETESTYELHGLTSTPATVKLALTPAVKDKVKVNLPEKVQINLQETHANENLNAADIELVRTQVQEALKVANKDAVVNDDTFDVSRPEEMNANASSIGVLVLETESTIDNPGLEAAEITVEIALVPMKHIVQPRGAKVQFTLQESLIGETIGPNDKAGLEAKILEQLTEANDQANINPDTFDINLDGWKVIEHETLRVHVNPTEATNEKEGLSEKDVIVDIDLTLFIAELNDLIKEKELGFIADKNPETILAAVKAKNPDVNVDAEVKVDTESISETGAKLIAKNPKKYQGTVEVKFGVIQDVASLLKGQTDLGYFDTPEEAKTAAEKVIADSELLKGNVLIAEPTAENEILVTANHESLTGEAKFTFSLRKDINELLNGKGILDSYIDAQTATKAVQKLVDGIEDLNDGKTKVEWSEETKEITVSSNHDSLKGAAKFTFKTSINLGELLPIGVRDLKEVKDPAEALIKANELIAELGLTGKVEVTPVQDKNEIKVTILEGLEGEEVTLTFTLPA